jgi:TnpA family transposase
MNGSVLDLLPIGNADRSQLKSCSSSEVAAMIEGLLRHGTDAGIGANYTDTHGASLVGFAFTELLGFKLLPG